ncbi:MAG: Uncharacterised protein [Halieaceae bacterium]|nr:MAG: Uncharacterised protein [Halieaceae bacterium]
MKVNVATSDRGDRRPSPHTPWPLVQPPPMRVPRPTRSPLVTINHNGAVDSAGTGWPMTLYVSKPPSSKPTKNRVRHRRSGPARDPQAIPLIPAIRPSESSNHMAERPNKTPPVSGNRYAFISTKLSIKDHRRQANNRPAESVTQATPPSSLPAQARDRFQEGAGLQIAFGCGCVVGARPAPDTL